MTDALRTRPGNTTVDITADRQILLCHFDTEQFGSTAVFFTPASAAKLGQQLIDLARQVDWP
jgi:hypothetical protein